MIRNLCLALALILGAANVASAQDFFLKKGDVVVMMGDSITEQRLYSNYVEMWSQTRYPHYSLTFRNVGIGGDRSTGGNARFKRDVLPFKPTVLTVDFGMNDGNYQWVGKKNKDKETTAADIDKSYAVYMKGHEGIAEQAKAAGIRVAWITPQPVEHKPGETNEMYNQTLEKFSAGVGEIAKKYNGIYIDQFHPYWAVVEKARKSGETGRITGGDAVHPGPAGQAVMAAAILKGMNFPRLVSAVDISGGQKGQLLGDIANCKITDISVSENGVRFTREDRALPFFPADAKSILKWTPLLEEMNDYRLRVRDLKPGKYDVKLDGKTIATYTHEELGKGVNLAGPALETGPVAAQVKEVVKAITDKTNYYHGQIYSPLVLGRNFAKNPDFKDVAKEDVEKRKQALIAERMQRMPELDTAIRKALAPRAHVVEITTAK
jgi:lysophospholipase L1-like esterase